MNEPSDIDPFQGIHTETKPTKPEKATKQTIKINLPKETPKKEDSKTKAKLIYAIKSYGKNKRFANYLENECGHNFDEGYLKKMTIDELKLELEKQDVALANKQNTSILDRSVKGGLQFMESLIDQRTKYKVKGTTDRLYEDNAYLDLLERVKIKYNLPFFSMDPVLELSLVIAQTAMVVHHENSYMASLEPKTDLNEIIEE